MRYKSSFYVTSSHQIQGNQLVEVQNYSPLVMGQIGKPEGKRPL